MAYFEVSSVSERQDLDRAGNETSFYDIEFEIQGAEGPFRASVWEGDDPVGNAKIALETKTAQVREILAL